MSTPTSVNSPTAKRLTAYWTGFIAVGGLMAIICLHDDYGITWDESVQSTYGELVLHYFESGFTDTRFNDFFNLKFYGPLFESTCALVYKPAQDLKFEIRHSCIAVTAVLTILGLVKFGLLFKDPFIPFFSSLALVMCPRFLGHSFNNSKDIPFACFFVWAIYAMARLLNAKEQSWRLWITCGLAFGLALSIRVGGMILFFYYLLSLAYLTLVHMTRSQKSVILRQLSFWSTRSAFLFVFSWMIMVTFWPWAHADFLQNPLKALIESTNFKPYHSVLFNGTYLKSTELPWYYLIKYLLITTPIPLLALAILGLAKSIKILLTEPQSPESLLSFILQVWLFFPLTYFVIKTPNVYDGLRHFLFILPTIAAFAGIGATGIYRSLAIHFPPKAIFCFVLIIILLPTKDMVSLHPYQMTYFSGWVGGLAKAHKNHETDYWLSSYKEAAEWINEQAKFLKKGKIKVLLAANNHSRLCAEHYFENHIESQITFETGIPGALPSEFDYYLSTTRYKLDKNYPNTPILHVVGRQNAVFTVVKGLRKNYDGNYKRP